MNKEFYDLVAPVYEKADKLRSRRPPAHICRMLKVPAQHRNFLDIGAGTGWIAKEAARTYDNVYATDISAKMLALIPEGIHTLVADATEELPFPEEMFDMITAVSVLHHLPSNVELIRNVDRLLKVGGVFYTDFDLDIRFAVKFDWPLWVYRWLFNDQAKAYTRRCPAVTKEMYHDSEKREYGIAITDAMIFFSQKWYDVRLVAHWGNGVAWPRGYAPYISLIAKKQG